MYPRTQQERIRIIERHYPAPVADTTTYDNGIAAENFGANDFDNEEADEDDCDD